MICGNIIINYNSLLFASANGHLEIVQLFVSQPGIDINSKDIWMQKSFIRFHFTDFIISRFYISYGIIEFNETPLI